MFWCVVGFWFYFVLFCSFLSLLFRYLDCCFFVCFFGFDILVSLVLLCLFVCFVLFILVCLFSIVSLCLGVNMFVLVTLCVPVTVHLLPHTDWCCSIGVLLTSSKVLGVVSLLTCPLGLVCRSAFVQFGCFHYFGFCCFWDFLFL